MQNEAVLNEHLAMLLDGGISDHWPDLVLSALIAFAAFLARNWFSSNEKRHDRAEDKFEKVDVRLNDHDSRIARNEECIENLERRREKR
jgi:hypothetical protein